MDDGAALLQAILDEPDEDVHRLVYADWLEDSGQSEGAEFIRGQVELAALQKKHYRECTSTTMRDIGTAPLRRRCNELLLSRVAATGAKTDIAWFAWAGAAGCIVPQGASFTDHLAFRRGFIETIRCPLQAWLDHGAAIVAQHPIRRVECSDKNPSEYPEFMSPGEVGYFRWFDGSRKDAPDSTDSDELPSGVWHAIHDSLEDWEFPTRDAAIDALSDALLALAHNPLPAVTG